MLQLGIPELPERISVETCLIGRDAARFQNLEAFELSTAMPSNQLTTNMTVTPINSLLQTTTQSPADSPLPSLKTYTDAEMITDGPNPMRDRELQTETPKLVSIEIQCNLEEELEEAEYKRTLTEHKASSENYEDVRGRFIEFIKEKARRFRNGKFECTVCSEIKPNAKLIAIHMAIHWGPPKLCAYCGVQFEHVVLWRKHCCSARRQKKRYHIKCPYYSCEVNAISPAELYDHLNEHCGLRPHRCSNCKRGFATSGELRLHRKLHKKCASAPVCDIYALPKEDTLHRKRVLMVKNARGKRVVVKFFLSQVSRQRNNITRGCAVCLKRCRNALHHQTHSKRCLEQHVRRVKHQREYILNDKTTNGHAVVNGI